MSDDPVDLAAQVAALDELVRDTVRRARNLTPRAWREPTPAVTDPRRVVALRLAGEWAALVHALEVGAGRVPSAWRRPRAPSHDYALPDLLAVTGHDLLSALRAADDTAPVQLGDVTTATELAALAVRETLRHRRHLLGARPPTAD